MRYLVPLNDSEANDEATTTVAVVVCNGKPKDRARRFRKWLSREMKISTYETQTAIIKGLGFDDIVP